MSSHYRALATHLLVAGNVLKLKESVDPIARLVMIAMEYIVGHLPIVKSLRQS